MLTHPTHDRLVALGLTGMAKALEEQRKQPDIAALGFEERLALMVDREAIERENKRLVSRLKFASLQMDAWSVHLRGQADALKIPVIDTTVLTIQEVADALEAQVEALRHEIRIAAKP